MPGRVRTFPGAGLAVPCDRIEYVYHLVNASCGRILRTMKRPYGAGGFWKYTIYMERCRVYMYMRFARDVCFLSILAWREGGNEQEQRDS